MPRDGFFVHTYLFLETFESDSEADNVALYVRLYLRLRPVLPTRRFSQRLEHQIVTDGQSGGGNFVLYVIAMERTFVTVCFSGRFESALHLRDVADLCAWTNVCGELVHHTAALGENIREVAIHFAHRLRVWVILDDLHLSFPAVRFERGLQPLCCLLLDVDMSHPTWLQVDSVSVIDEVVGCAIRMNLNQQSVQPVIEVVVLPRYVPKHEQPVLPVVAVRDETLFVVLVWIELSAQRLRGVPVIKRDGKSLFIEIVIRLIVLIEIKLIYIYI